MTRLRNPWGARGRLLLIPVILALAGLTTGLAVAATDPDWAGTAPVQLSQSNTRETYQPVIATGPSGQMAVTWSDQPTETSKSDIYLTYTEDRGNTWSTPEVISPTASKSQLPSAVIARGNIFVAWSEERALTSTTFTIHEAEPTTEPRAVPIPGTDSPSGITTGPRLAAGPARLHVVFNAGKVGTPDSHILHASRRLTETTWPTAKRVYTSTQGLSWFPALAVSPDGEDIHVVWEKMILGSGRYVMYMRGTVNDAVVSWASPITLSTGITLSVKPDIAVSASGDAHVVWGEVNKESDSTSSHSYVRYRRYEVNSKEWTSAKRIDSQAVYVNEINPTDTAPRMSMWEQNGQVTLCVAWHGFREGESAEDVLISCSQDSGDTWASPRTMSPTPDGVEQNVDISIWPSIAFDSSGTVHGVWQQRVEIINETSYYETYYTHALHQVFLPLVTRSS
jgi:hypothetical protein